jgi:hypothetical protein
MNQQQQRDPANDTGYVSDEPLTEELEDEPRGLPQNAALVRKQNQQLQHQRDRKPGILSEDFYSTFEQRGPSAVDYARKEAEKQIQSGLEETLRLRLDLNLDLEVRLRAHVHGDLTLALLYFPLKDLRVWLTNGF